MSGTDDILTATADRLFGELCTPALYSQLEGAVWPSDAWAALAESGLDKATTSEARGGAGASAREVAAVLRVAGARALPLPLAETLLAELALAAAGLAPEDGPLTIGPVFRRDRLALARRGGRWTLSGTLRRIPWGRGARLVAIADTDDGPATVLVDKASRIRAGSSDASEPRDDLFFDDLVLDDARVGAPGAGMTAQGLYAAGALYRAVQMVGALETVLQLTVDYAKTRTQFGRPIGKFQAVQQQIAVMACHVAAAGAACDGAAEAFESGPAHVEIGIAKARIGEAAGIAAAIAHQVHASMGFTHEYPLHLSTRRLWSWREEFGSETEWMRWIGRNALAMGGEALWPFLTAGVKKPAVPLAEMS